ncbi:hypothetical protein ABL78_3630 [Leptomonas seymouri]|uniref:Uncharacterized protein n=1 Tax=Leptomonas seymouri TaxID=5684 RepID=A0A0N1PC15_LEPSE|nr:hypothetical protein ABL78_3630 [Leptomonas seymouri]|eukprot:KPI87293.1 hypothetical protein ABL78_3630 [Leptomonas seymouri]
MMEYSRPTLLQLLSPSGATASNLYGQKGQDGSSLSVAPAAATAAAAPVDYEQCVLPAALSEMGPVATTDISIGEVAPLANHGCELAAPLNTFGHNDLRQQVARGKGYLEAERPSEAITTLSKVSMRLVPPTFPSIYAPYSVATAAPSSGEGQTERITSAISTSAIDAALTVVAAPLDPVTSTASIVTTISSNRATAPPTRNRHQSPYGGISPSSDVDGDRGWEVSPQSRSPPRMRRATLAGSSGFLDTFNLDSQVEVNRNDRFQEASATRSTVSIDEMSGPSRKDKDGAPASEYRSNFLMSSGLNLFSTEYHTSLEVSSAAVPAKANVCSPTSSAIVPSCEQAAGSALRVSQGCVPHVSFERREQRLPRVTLLPEAKLANSLDVVGSLSAEVQVPKSSGNLEPVAQFVSPMPNDGTQLAVRCARAAADAVEEEENNKNFAETAVDTASESENIVDKMTEMTLSHFHTNTFIDINNSEAESLPSVVSLNASITTQREHTPLSITCAFDSVKIFDNAAKSTAALSPAEPKGSEEGGGIWGPMPYCSSETTKYANHSGSPSTNTCTALLMPQQPETLCAQGATPSTVRASLVPPTVESRGANDLNSLSSAVDDFSFAQDAVAQQHGGLGNCPPNESAEGGQSESPFSALCWAQRFLRVTVGGVSSLMYSFFWRYVRRGRPRVLGVLSIVKTMLFYPFRRMAPSNTGEGDACSSNKPVKGCMKTNPPLHSRSQLEPSGASFSPSSTTLDAVFGVPRGNNVSFSEVLQLSLPLSLNGSLEMSDLEGWQRVAPSSQAIGDLQQSLRDTWNGAASAWFSTEAQLEPRTALCSSARIRRSLVGEPSPSSPPLQPPSGLLGNGVRGDDGDVLHSEHSVSPSFSHLPFATGCESLSSSAVFSCRSLLPISSTLAAAMGSGSFVRGSTVVDLRSSFTESNQGAIRRIRAPARSAPLDDEYRQQLYHSFRHPPSCSSGDLTSCVAAYKAMVETSSTAHHVLNWKELSFLLLPEDYIDYCNLFPPFHFVTFPDFVEFVEVLSVRHRR